MKNQAQLIAYVDRLPGGTLRDLTALMRGPLSGVVGGVHVLPFFHPIDGADAGFDPIDHTQVDARLGTWEDVRALAEGTDVMADLIVNHVSRHSPQFQDFDRSGAESPSASLFLTFDRVFPHGATEADLNALYTIRAALPFTPHQARDGRRVLLWTTFTSDQVDIDVEHDAGRRYLSSVLAQFHTAGIRAIRLDAAGHAVKRAGTSCYMLPETFAFIAEVTREARALGMEVLVEMHGAFEDQIAIARLVDFVYDFALPPLVLHMLYTRDVSRLLHWLTIRPGNAITVLDTHDGIGVRDASGLMPAPEIDALVRTLHERSDGASLLASGTAASNLDSSQINCTFYDALGRRDAEYLIARAVQCFVPGIPQIYYVGLMAGRNDVERLRRTSVGRDINRHAFTASEWARESARPVVESLIALLRFRNSHPAFAGTFDARPSAGGLTLAWQHGAQFARLDVDLARMSASVACSGEGIGQWPW